MTDQPPILQSDAIASAPEDREMLTQFRLYRASRHTGLRDQLVAAHLYLVQSIARRFSGLGESMDDLIQEGSIGLLNALGQFDPDRGVKFTTYASHLITSHIQHYLRDRGRLIRQPAWVQELSTKVTKCSEQLAQQLGRPATTAEIAEQLSLPESSIHNVLATQELNHVTSLQIAADGASDGDLPTGERESSSTTEILQFPVEDRMLLDEAILTLKPLEQQVVHQYFYEDMRQSDIARKLNISVNYASYLLRRATTKIRAYLDEQRVHETAALLDQQTPASVPFEFSLHDPVTKTYSDSYFRARVAEEIARTQRYPSNFALLFTEVRGIHASEESYLPILVTIGQLLARSIRVVDLLAHLDGERFALLLPHTGREARVLAERICATITDRHPALSLATSSLYVNVGYAVFPIDGASEKVLFERTAQALHAAIKKGPGTIAGVPERR